MKLLICTQKIDKNDDVLGFFHRWVEEFARHAEKVTVICLYKGTYRLPDNVTVLSLGKEEGGSRLAKAIRYVGRFYRYAWWQRNNYDAVFVHMNQEYVLLGAPLWKLLGKNITLWRNHARGSMYTRLAAALAEDIFYTSPQSFTARFKKAAIMPVGIDTQFFKPDPAVERKQNSLLFLGRIAPVKNVEAFIHGLKALREMHVPFSATIAGAPLPSDAAYMNMIRTRVSEYGLNSYIEFVGAVTQREALRLYQGHSVYVNLTPRGSMDKTIFEALGSGCRVVVANTFFNDILPKAWIVGESENPEMLARAFRNALIGEDKSGKKINTRIFDTVRAHSLDRLMEKITAVMVENISKKIA